jgi:hypothetical protein
VGAIGKDTSLQELAALISGALESAGIEAPLSGGGAVSFYSHNEYESFDLDFITSATTETLARVIKPLGFERVPGAREFRHADTELFVEFPPGPLAFGETVAQDSDAAVLQTEFGPVRIITPTQSVMDRLAAYTHWNDRQAFDQAVMVARRQNVEWTRLQEWAATEGLGAETIESFRERVEVK